jgi:alkanesulfonate monooxygenase
MMSGSSAAGLEAGRALGIPAIKYPEHPAQEVAQSEAVPPGVRIGIISRDSAAEAWAEAVERFPDTRAGRVGHQFAVKASDSHWHRQLAKGGDSEDGGVYWLGPFRNNQAFCPYLVGDHHSVGRVIAAYHSLGFRLFILGIPSTREDLRHANDCFVLARELLRGGS